MASKSSRGKRRKYTSEFKALLPNAVLRVDIDPASDTWPAR